MATWLKMGGGYNGDAGGEAPIYWYNQETGETSGTEPRELQMARPAGWTEKKYMNGQHTYWENNQTGEIVYGNEKPMTPEEADQKFKALMQDPNASAWDKVQAIEKKHGIETVAQMAKSGAFANTEYGTPEGNDQLGRYIAARQAEGEAEGFSIGGNQLGLWPVFLGVAAFAMAAGGLATSTGGTTAGSTAGGELAAGEMAGAYGGMDAAAVAGADYSAVTAESMASSYLGNEVATTSGKEFLLADSGTTMTDVGGGMLESGTSTTAPAASAETGAFDMGQFAPQDMGLDAASMTKTPGLIETAMTGMKNNPIATLVGGQLVGGVVSGIGQAKMQEDKQDHERQLLEQRLDDQQALEEWKRRFTQQGSYFDATPKLKPAADTRLKRPDGTPVHGPNGLISRTMGA